jgi:hypothetical protein
MRVVAEIPHSNLKITIFAWNSKYLIKLEKGVYEQTYKISEMDVNGDEEIRNIAADPQFISGAMERFIEMNKGLNEALNRM